MRYAYTLYRVRPNCIQHDHAVCAVRSAYSISIVRLAVVIIMVQSFPDCAVVVRSAFSETLLGPRSMGAKAQNI